MIYFNSSNAEISQNIVQPWLSSKQFEGNEEETIPLVSKKTKVHPQPPPIDVAGAEGLIT